MAWVSRAAWFDRATRGQHDGVVFVVRSDDGGNAGKDKSNGRVEDDAVDTGEMVGRHR